MNVNIEDSQITLLIEIDGEIHLVGMSQERLEAIEILFKRSVEVIVPTNKTQKELNEFLGYNK